VARAVSSVVGCDVFLVLVVTLVLVVEYLGEDEEIWLRSKAAL